MSAKIFTFKNKRNMPGWLAWLIVFAVRLYAWTFRVEIDDPYGWYTTEKMKTPGVMAVWHNRVLFLAAVARREYLSTITALSSKSRDGGYIAAIAMRFGVSVVRGSSSKGGLHALLELNQELQKGQHPLLTVDGPRGPRYEVHSGAAFLAQHNQVPLIPVALNAKKYWQLRSWDGTQIPKPFTKITLRFGEGFLPAKEESLEELNARLKQQLMAICED